MENAQKIRKCWYYTPIGSIASFWDWIYYEWREGFRILGWNYDVCYFIARVHPDCCKKCEFFEEASKRL